MSPPSTWSRRGLGIAAIGLLGVGGLCAGVLHLPAAAPGYRLLSAEEIAWIDAYHARVRDTVGPLLDPQTAAWLERATRPIGAGAAA